MSCARSRESSVAGGTKLIKEGLADLGDNLDAGIGKGQVLIGEGPSAGTESIAHSDGSNDEGENGVGEGVHYERLGAKHKIIHAPLPVPEDNQ